MEAASTTSSLKQRDAHEETETREEVPSQRDQDKNTITNPVFVTNLRPKESPFQQYLAAINTVTAKEEPKIIYRRKNDPYNEFTHNRQILLGLFFDLFTLGIGIYKQGPLNDRQVRHLMYQYDGRFGKNHLFLFLMFNQYMRHVNIRDVNAYIENNDEKIEIFNGWLKDEQFQKDLQKAADDPDSEFGKQMTKKILPVLHHSSGAVPRCGPFHQRFVTTSLINYLRFFGYPSMFVTLSPNDSESVLGLKLCIGAANIRENMNVSYEERLQPIRVDFSSEERNNFIQRNPHLYAIAFQRMVETFFQTMIGLDLEVNMRRSTPLAKRKPGIFGVVSAFFGVIESQARGSLHIHILLFGGSIRPELLDRAAISKDLRQAAADVIDSMIQAHVSGEMALRDLQRRKNKQAALRPILSPLLTKEEILSSKNIETRYIEKLRKTTELSLCATNNHTHSFSCRKGIVGKTACRFAYPQSIVPTTRPVALMSRYEEFLQTAPEHEIGKLMQDVHNKENVKVKLDALEWIARKKRSAVARINEETGELDNPCEGDLIYWELKRPKNRVEDCQETYRKVVFEDIFEFIPLTDPQKEKYKADKRKFDRFFEDYNKTIVEYNPCIATALQCNHSIQMLGSSKQAKAATFYCTEYMAKRETDQGKILAILWQAIQDVKNYPSTAEDANSESRNAKHLLQRFCNKIVGRDEISAPMAALVVTGHSCSTGSHSGKFVEIWDPSGEILKNRDLINGIVNESVDTLRKTVQTTHEDAADPSVAPIDVSTLAQPPQPATAEAPDPSTVSAQVPAPGPAPGQFDSTTTAAATDVSTLAQPPQPATAEAPDPSTVSAQVPAPGPAPGQFDSTTTAAPQTDVSTLAQPPQPATAEAPDPSTITVEAQKELLSAVSRLNVEYDLLTYQKSIRNLDNVEPKNGDNNAEEYVDDPTSNTIANPDGELDLENAYGDGDDDDVEEMDIRLQNDEAKEIKTFTELKERVTYKHLHYRINKDKGIWLTPWFHYHLRGEELKNLSYFEYTALIEVVKIPEIDREQRYNKRKQQKKTGLADIPPAGRRENSTFYFLPIHPLYDLHYQRIRSKIVIPFLAGNSPPKISEKTLKIISEKEEEEEEEEQDEDELEELTEAERRELELCAVYYMILLIPWKLPQSREELMYGPELDLTVDNFVKWLRQITVPESIDCFLRKYALNTMRMLRTNHEEGKLFSSYRRKEAQVWGSSTDNDAYAQGLKGLGSYEGLDVEELIIDEIVKDYQNQVDEALEYQHMRKATAQYDEEKALLQQEFYDNLRNSMPGASSSDKFGQLWNAVLEEKEGGEEGREIPNVSEAQQDNPNLPSISVIVPDLRKRLLPILLCEAPTAIEISTAPELYLPEQHRTDLSAQTATLLNAIYRADEPILNLRNYYENQFQSAKIIPSVEQCEIILKIIQCIPKKAFKSSLIQKSFDVSKEKDSEQLLLLVHGGPGTGKSTIIQMLSIFFAGAFDDKDFPKIAPTGIAATLINGRTLHSFLRLQKNNSAEKLEKKISADQADGITKLVVPHQILIVDETSMISLELLLYLDKSFREAFPKNAKKPFGGVSVILFGDFFQLPPVCATSLAKNLVDVEVQKASGKTEKEKKKIGVHSMPRQKNTLVAAELFKQFQKVELTQQQRVQNSSDTQATVVRSFRNFETLGLPVISQELLDSIQNVDHSLNYDLPENQKWLIAPVVVATNRERQTLNKERIQILAKIMGVPVIAWKLPIKLNKKDPELIVLGDYLKANLQEFYNTHDDPHMYFVPHAPCCLTYNFNVENKLANGTTVFLHHYDLSPNMSEEELENLRNQINDHGNIGKIIQLPYPPSKLYYYKATDNDHPLYHEGIERERKWKECFSKTELFEIDMTDETSASNHSCSRMRVFYRSNKGDPVDYIDYGIELKLSVTFHKIQGITALYLILQLRRPPDALGSSIITFFTLYVALTRTKGFEYLRKLSISKFDVHALTKLTAPDWLVIFMRNYHPDGELFQRWFDDPDRLLYLKKQTGYGLSTKQKQQKETARQLVDKSYDDVTAATDFKSKKKPQKKPSSTKTMESQTRNKTPPKAVNEMPEIKVEKTKEVPHAASKIKAEMSKSESNTGLNRKRGATTKQKGPDYVDLVNTTENIPTIKQEKEQPSSSAAIPSSIHASTREQNLQWAKNTILSFQQSDFANLTLSDINDEFLSTRITNDIRARIDVFLDLPEIADLQLTPYFRFQAFQCLRQMHWINDTIIDDFVLSILRPHRIAQNENQEFQVFPTYVAKAVLRYQRGYIYSQAQCDSFIHKIRARINFRNNHDFTSFGKAYIAITMPNHFFVLEYDSGQNTFNRIDSIQSFSYGEHLQNLKKGLNHVVCSLTGKATPLWAVRQSTQQSNQSNCGVHVMYNMLRLISNKDLNYPEQHINTFRYVIVILFFVKVFNVDNIN